MCYSTLAGLTLILCAATAAGQAIPQDPKLSQQRAEEAFAWNKRTLGEAYEKVGKRDPRWDAPARAALEAALRFFTKQTDPVARIEDIYVPAKKAIDAGCNDPLILYLYARSSYDPNYPGPKELERRFAAAATALEKSDYPAVRRAYALGKAGLVKADKDLTPEVRRESARLLDAAVAVLPKAAEDVRDRIAHHHWLDLVTEAIDAHERLSGDHQAAFERVDTVLAKHPELKVLRLKAKGDFFIHWGWEARGSGFADTVTPEGWKQFGARLAEARKALEEAWEASPGDAFVASKMLILERSQGGNRDNLEKWFERAMKAEPDNLQACREKLDWLDPKWHGTIEEMLAFGRACGDTKNWRSGIPLLLAEAHRKAMQHLPPEKRLAYFRTPGIWDEIRDVYVEYLKRYPTDNAERSRYAGYCYLCGQHAESDRQFQILGDNLVFFRYTFTEKWMKQIKAAVVGKGKR